MNVYEMIAFIAYFVLVIGVGIYFFFKSKGNAGEKDYFLPLKSASPKGLALLFTYLALFPI